MKLPGILTAALVSTALLAALAPTAAAAEPLCTMLDNCVDLCNQRFCLQEPELPPVEELPAFCTYRLCPDLPDPLLP